MALTPFLKDFLEKNQNQVGVQAAITAIPSSYGGQSRKQGIAGSNAFQDYWRGQASSVYNQYLGEFARNPEAQLGDYLDAYPWLQKFQDLSPSMRGEQNQRYAPRVRWSG
jgi:hypothetical protein